MTVSVYSLTSAVIFYSIALTAVCILCRRANFLKRYGVSCLLLITVLAVIRLALPLDFTFSYVLESWTVWPAVRGFLRSNPWITGILLGLWTGGTAFVLMRDALSVANAYRISRSYWIVENERVQQIAERLGINCPVVVSPDVQVPYAAGFFRHTIYFPAWEISDGDIELALLHEVQHIRSHDALIKLLFGLLSAVFWWNPVVYKFREEIDRLLELRCDAKVTASMDFEGKGQYLTMLLNMMKHTVKTQQVLPWSAAARQSSIQQRFMVLLDKQNPPRRMGIAVKCCLIVVFFSSYMVIFQPAGMPPPEDGSTFTISEDLEPLTVLNSSWIITLEDQYYLVDRKGKKQVIKEISYEEVNSIYKNLHIVEGCIS